MLWMRFVGPPKSHVGTGYAPATINHNLAVLKAFYDDRREAGRAAEFPSLLSKMITFSSRMTEIGLKTGRPEGKRDRHPHLLD